MIARIKGKLVYKYENKLGIELGGFVYDVNVPQTVAIRVNAQLGEEVELVVYHYFAMEQTRGVPVLIGFCDELERDFFEKFISVAGIGPKAAIKALDKPVTVIARAIENGDQGFLKTLAGIGTQKAKQIIVSLQGKVGRFALIKDQTVSAPWQSNEIIEEARGILKRLQYNTKEIDDLMKKVSTAKQKFENVEELLNEIYRQKH
jgi:Holliday junction DNA helicase RuvA